MATPAGVFTLNDNVLDVQVSAVDPNLTENKKRALLGVCKRCSLRLKNRLEPLVAVHPKPAAGVRSGLVTTLTTSSDFNKAIDGFDRGSHNNPHLKQKTSTSPCTQAVLASPKKTVWKI